MRDHHAVLTRELDMFAEGRNSNSVTPQLCRLAAAVCTQGLQPVQSPSYAGDGTGLRRAHWPN